MWLNLQIQKQGIFENLLFMGSPSQNRANINRKLEGKQILSHCMMSHLRYNRGLFLKHNHLSLDLFVLFVVVGICSTCC